MFLKEFVLMNKNPLEIKVLHKLYMLIKKHY
nr:MAG TPA: hypothetical protein [Bacteriophage sp.]